MNETCTIYFPNKWTAVRCVNWLDKKYGRLRKTAISVRSVLPLRYYIALTITTLEKA